MPRWSEFDTDEERLPEGFQRIGYDADTQVYTFRDAEGKAWESAPGNRYGRLHPVSTSATPLPSYDDDDDDDNSNPMQPLTYGGGIQQQQQQTSWRHDMMPLLNWFLLVGLFLLGVIWFISRGGGEGGDKGVVRNCGDGAVVYEIRAGDTCWDIAEARAVSVDKLLEGNEGLDCDGLVVGEVICVPENGSGSGSGKV